MNDHDFARWLRDHGWEGAYAPEAQPSKSTTLVRFTDAAGKVLAKCLYDNAHCTKQVFLREI